MSLKKSRNKFGKVKKTYQSAWDRPISHPAPYIRFEPIIEPVAPTIKPKRVHRTSYESYEYHYQRLKNEGFGMDPKMSKSEFEFYYELAKRRGEKNIPRQFASEDRTYGKREAKSIVKALQNLDSSNNPLLQAVQEKYKTAADVYGAESKEYPESFTGTRFTARQEIWKATIEAIKAEDEKMQKKLRSQMRKELEGIVY